MAAALLLRLHDRRLQATQEMLDLFKEELRQNGATQPLARQRRDLDDLIRDCLAYPDILHQICQSSFEAINDGAVLDTDKEGRELEAIFDRTISFMRDVLDLIQRFNGPAVPPPDLNRLNTAIDTITQRRDRVFANWPWSNQPGPAFDLRMAQASREDYQRGDWQDIKEVIRELQGSHPQTD